MLLAIETSCDETAVAVLDVKQYVCHRGASGEILRADIVSSQTKLHEPYGGVVPELAAREHILNLPILVQRALQESSVTAPELSAIAVTRGPGLKGCLLVGLCYAKALAYSSQLPLLALNHIEGHIFAAELLPEKDRPEYPFIALVVSGGHSLLVEVSSFRNYKPIAKTRDDAAGEAFDKGAMLLGLPYPGGPSLANAAVQGNPRKFAFPVGVAADPHSFSFSGLKTALQRTVTALGPQAADSQVVSDLAASYQYAVVRALCEKSLVACEMRRPKSFVLTGGVAANECLRSTLQSELAKRSIKFCVPERRWCTDNASMIGMLACRIIAASPEDYWNWANPGQDNNLIGPNVPADIGALPKWPLEQLFD
jgi:N6-L-threonylcarbamoyladenine synthase